MSKFKLKKICITNSCYLNDKHNVCSYLNSIGQILTLYELSDGIKLSGYIVNDECFIATFLRMNPLGVDIECEINFETTTLTITVKE